MALEGLDFLAFILPCDLSCDQKELLNNNVKFLTPIILAKVACKAVWLVETDSESDNLIIPLLNLPK